MALERVAELIEAVAGSRDEDPHLLTSGDRSLATHWLPPPSRVLRFACLETVLEEREVGLGSLGAVGRVRRRPERERPSAVLRHPEELLLLRVGERELDREALVGVLGDLRLHVGLDRGLEDEDVAQERAAHVVGLVLRRVPRADDVDTVAGLQRPGQQLMLVAGNLDGAEVARELGADAPLRFRLEAQLAHLLALVDLGGDDLRGDVRRIEKRAWRDLAALDLGGREVPAGVELCARRSDGDVLGRHPDRDELLIILEPTPLLGDVIEDEQDRDGGERDREPEIAESIRHCTTSFWSRIECLIGVLGP